MSSPVLLVLGAGPNIGKSLAQKFTKKGYKVALVGRKLAAHDGASNSLLLKADLSDPTSVKGVFDEVKSKLGVPNIVVYNAAAATFTPDPLSVPVSTFADHLTINTTSVYASVKEAVSGFETLPADLTKAFIYTGNLLNVTPMPVLFDLGVGKAATANLIHGLSLAYSDKGYQFYFADERTAEGGAVDNKVSGEYHADFYAELAERKSQGPWQATFVGGKGYVDFQK